MDLNENGLNTNVSYPEFSDESATDNIEAQPINANIDTMPELDSGQNPNPASDDNLELEDKSQEHTATADVPQTIEPENVPSKKTSFSAKIISNLIVRAFFYVVLMVLVLMTNYPEPVRLVLSLSLAVIGMVSNFFIMFFNFKNAVLGRYVCLSLALLDIGVCGLFVFLSESAYNVLMLSFPVLAWTMSLFSKFFDFSVIFLISVCFYFIASILFGGIMSFDYQTGFIYYMAVLAWAVIYKLYLLSIKRDKTIKGELIGFLEKIIDSFPIEIREKIGAILTSEKIIVLESEYKNKVSVLEGLISSKDKELNFFKETLQGGGDNSDLDDSNPAISQLNSFLEMENLSLKENNKKLMDMNKLLEERLLSVTQELEIANSELERIYSSLEEEKQQHQE